MSYVIFIFMGFLSATAMAQDAAEGGGGDEALRPEISIHLGHLLPNQIEGVTEILPVYGFRYAYPFGATMGEFSYANSHAYGVDFTTLSASVRGGLSPIKDVMAIFYGGLDMHYYRKENTTAFLSDYGGHVGGGLMMHIADTLWFRGDMKFNMNPGTALYIGFGLAFQQGASEN